MHAVLLAEELLLVLAQPAVVQLQRLVVGRGDTELPGVVKVQRGYLRGGVRVLEGFGRPVPREPVADLERLGRSGWRGHCKRINCSFLTCSRYRWVFEIDKMRERKREGKEGVVDGGLVRWRLVCP